MYISGLALLSYQILIFFIKNKAIALPKCEEELVEYLLEKVQKEHKELRETLITLEDLLDRANTSYLYSELTDHSKEMKDEEIERTILLPSSCSEAIKFNGVEGVHLIKVPFSGIDPFYAYCLPDSSGNGTAWTVILRRMKGSLDFNRKWDDYKYGFGSLFRDHWLGLEAVHAMTYFQRHELRINIWAPHILFDGSYERFEIGDENSGYAINVLGEEYSDTFEDSLQFHSGNRFSTFDRDSSINKCASGRKAGWWFFEKPPEPYKCGTSFLTGNQSFVGKDNPTHKGIQWNSIPNKFSSVYMAIRPIFPYH